MKRNIPAALIYLLPVLGIILLVTVHEKSHHTFQSMSSASEMWFFGIAEFTSDLFLLPSLLRKIGWAAGLAVWMVPYVIAFYFVKLSICEISPHRWKDTPADGPKP
jgi:uncharacterized membrane protein